MLEIKNLYVSVESENVEEEILKNINLKFEEGKTYVLMGPNGSGKSTLANVIMGHPNYKITSGKILFNGEDITKLNPNERSKKGVFLSFQNPREFKGISVFNFLKNIYNESQEKKLSSFEFKNFLEVKLKELDLKEEFLFKSLNDGFSGGEKKKMEILQMILLKPKLSILDEIDSGLDIDSLKLVSKTVNEFRERKIKDIKKSLLLITHYNRLLKYISPDKVFIIVNGEVVLEGKREIVDHLEEKGYGWVEKEMKKD